MSRPKYERTKYVMPDISVKLTEESHKRIVSVLYETYGYGKANSHLSFKRITTDTGISADVMRHFISENHIRLSSLQTLCSVLKEKVSFKTIIKAVDENGREIM